ncbi:MAG: family 65 glycosyl hydrolase [Clostridia bacterium]|nr:family 65 glycosyl hydrolase [Clostridia bacterium]
MAKAADVYFAVDPWKIIEKGFNPAYSRVSESVFSLANENMGVRGYFDEGGCQDSLRGFYVNGVYDVEHIGRSYKGIIDKSHFMIPTAEWLGTCITVDGEKLELQQSNFSDFSRTLDMRAGTLERSFIWHTASGKDLKITFLRFLNMVNRERAYQRITLKACNFAGKVGFSSAVSFDIAHEGRGKCFWQDVKCEASKNSVMLKGRTLQSEQEVFAGAIVDVSATVDVKIAGKTAVVSCTLNLVQGQEIRADKRAVILFDGTEGELLWQNGLKAMDALGNETIEDALRIQREYWDAYWRTSDIQIDAAEEADEDAVTAEQQGIRFCSFQLAQTYSGGSMRHNIGAKGLTGEAYNGHAFWDTEACCLPFYLFTNPAAAKDLLLFRYNTLQNAIERAKMLDCKGACYPIATLNGDEACPLWQHASLQLQPSTAVAYGIWHYVHLTKDQEFLRQYGAEILLQIARFMASRVELGGKNGKYGYFGVMGPDEFHMMVNNNAYTNYMGMRTLAYAAEVLEQMRCEFSDQYAKLVQKTALDEDEIKDWMHIARNMYIPQDPEGLIEQHDGYFDLPHTDINAIPVNEFPLYEHWAYDRIYRSDMIKQPDVLMFLYLYNSSFTHQEKLINYDFYQPRTIHESSLSPAIHSILAAELDKMDEAIRFFGYATRLDLDNYNRNTREGLHITSIALAWVNIVYGFAGLRSDGEMLRFAPRLPDRWKRLQFSVIYQGRVILISMEPGKTSFRIESGEAVEVMIYNQLYTLDKNETMIDRQ